MTENFSGAIRVADLSDFIAPSQTCVVANPGTNNRVVLDNPGEVQIKPLRQEMPKESEPVKISLQDCLACSGCVTSAETVLLEQQSTEEFLSQLRNPESYVVVSIAPQAWASLAVYFQSSPLETVGRLSHFLRSLGVRRVLDLTAARQVALEETSAEFISRLKSHTQHQDQQPSTGVAAPPPPPPPLPMIASACPGWVCYAEKTHGSYVLPHLSTAKSPQAVQGTLVKRWLASADSGPWKVNQNSVVFHVAVMPCYDKKLEAAREELKLPPHHHNQQQQQGTMPTGAAAPEVDCVLTSGELLTLIQEKAVDFCSLPVAPLDRMSGQCLEDDGPPPSAPGALVPGSRQANCQAGTSGSGGYLEHCIRRAADELHGLEVSGQCGTALEYRALRNQDFKETHIQVADQVVLKCAQVYGFRNIQTLLRKIKAKKCEYHYIEIMACPSGCLNGGGQIKPDIKGGQTGRQLLEQVERQYFHREVVEENPSDNPELQEIYANWIGDKCFSEKARDLFHTEFREREKINGQLINSDW